MAGMNLEVNLLMEDRENS